MGILVAYCMIYFTQAFAQKPAINPLDLRYMQLHDQQLSKEGKYVSYYVGFTLYVVDTLGRPVVHFERTRGAVFAGVGKEVVFIQRKDSVMAYNLQTKRLRLLGRSFSFRLLNLPDADYVLHESADEIFLQPLCRDAARSFPKRDYVVSPTAAAVFSHRGNVGYWLDVRTGAQDSVVVPGVISQPCFDDSGTKVAFYVSDSTRRAVYRVEQGVLKPIRWASEGEAGVPALMAFADGALAFNATGERLFAYLREKTATPTAQPNIPRFNLWSYTDNYFPTDKANSYAYRPKQRFLSVLSTGKSGVTIIEQADDAPISITGAGDILLIQSEPYVDAYYNPLHWPSLWLYDLRTHIRTAVSEQTTAEFTELTLSPNGKHVAWFSKEDLAYYSYSVVSGTLTNISAGIPTSIIDAESQATNRLRNHGIAGWTADGRYLLVYDPYDVWKVDPQGNRPPVNVTGGFGSKHGICLGIIKTEPSEPVVLDDRLLLSGFSRANKQNGIFRMGDLKDDAPERHMDDCHYHIARVGAFGYISIPRSGAPQQAKENGVYLLTHMTAQSAPNLMLTRDFKKYQRLTDYQPQKQVNWLTAELVNFPTLDGGMQQGILYKPEDFDSTRAYPVIFNYYETRSDELHQFLQPDLVAHNINIPLFVSNGYLVFVPDVKSRPGRRGEGTYNSIVGAAEYLRRFPWVDASRMALQGHSYGGFQTNYLVTHTRNLFAAACEMAGTSNSISSYNYVGLNGHRARHFETQSQGAAQGVGVTPWTDPDAYIRESAVLSVNAATTPLFMVHNRSDSFVPFEQAIELYTAMKRAGKAVWLMEYEDEHHQLINTENQRDFTIRLFQFFDHYLKAAPAPAWMTQGIPPQLKGVETGYALDAGGRCSEGCMICN